MTEEELRDLVTGHQMLTADERHIVSEVFDAGKRQIREVLVPRTEVDFLPASMPLEQATTIAAKAPHSRFPVFEDSYDDVIGFVHARDLFDPGPQRLGAGRRARSAGEDAADQQNRACPRCRRCGPTGRTWRSSSTSTVARPAS